MPSPLAHAVSGYVLSKLLPLKPPMPRWKWLQLYYPVFVATAADLDFIPQLITGGSFHRGLSHSLAFAFLFSAIAALIFNRNWFRSLSFTLIFYSSHLVLDFFSEGRGIQLFSPFTEKYFRSPLVIFPGIHHSRGLWDYSHITPMAFELVYSALLLFGLWWCTARARITN